MEEGCEVFLTALLGDLGQIGRVVGPFTEHGVAVDAVVAVPHMLALDDLLGQRVCIGEGIELTMAIDRQAEEHQGKEESSYDKEQPSVTLCHDGNGAEKNSAEENGAEKNSAEENGAEKNSAITDIDRSNLAPSDIDDAPVLNNDESCVAAGDHHQKEDDKPQTSKELKGKARAFFRKWRD